MTKVVKIEYLIILALLMLLFCERKSGEKNSYEVKKIERDTLMIQKVDSLSKLFAAYRATEPKVVYVKVKEQELQRISPEEIEHVEPDADIMALHEYTDTLQNEDLTIYSKVLTDGKVYENKIKYKLNYPMVKETQYLTKKQPSSGLFLYTQAGSNTQRLDHLGLGLQYVHKNKWFVGYGVNINGFPKPTHHVTIGLKLR